MPKLRKTGKNIVAAALLAGFVTGLLGTSSFLVYQQTAEAQSSVEDRRAQLEAELAQIEKEIEGQKTILDTTQKQRASLERDVTILNAEIQKAKLNIKARNLAIQKLTEDIGSKQKNINTMSAQIDREKDSLAEILRKTNDMDSYTLVEAVLAQEQLSEFYGDLETYDVLKTALHDSYTVIGENKKKTQEERDALEDKKEEESKLRELQVLQQKRVEQQEAEKRRLVATTKGQEKEYQKLINAKEKTAAQIRTELFSLRGSAAIPFEKAYQYAKAASAKTGVRPAFILGIIAEESNLGENVGTGSWKTDMKAPRDTVPFLEITRKLGLDPDKMPVSAKPWYGWGGAMGPAQFIPSTWVLYEEKIAQAVGVETPNPWNPEHAFMASAILSKENGADKGTAAAERLAALRYLAGWTNANKKEYAFYGDDVMALAAKYQKLIDILER